jgi:hypothetical protein
MDYEKKYLKYKTKYIRLKERKDLPLDIVERRQKRCNKEYDERILKTIKNMLLALWFILPNSAEGILFDIENYTRDGKNIKVKSFKGALKNLLASVNRYFGIIEPSLILNLLGSSFKNYPSLIKKDMEEFKKKTDIKEKNGRILEETLKDKHGRILIKNRKEFNYTPEENQEKLINTIKLCLNFIIKYIDLLCKDGDNLKESCLIPYEYMGEGWVYQLKNLVSLDYGFSYDDKIYIDNDIHITLEIYHKLRVKFMTSLDKFKEKLKEKNIFFIKEEPKSKENEEKKIYFYKEAHLNAIEEIVVEEMHKASPNYIFDYETDERILPKINKLLEEDRILEVNKNLASKDIFSCNLPFDDNRLPIDNKTKPELTIRKGITNLNEFDFPRLDDWAADKCKIRDI